MSKIPEGATHTTRNGNGDIFYRRKMDDDWYEYIDRAWRKLIYATPREYTPIQSEPEWSGEGLPPVGTVCEAKTSRGWSSGTIIAHGLPPKENLAVWQEDGELIFWGENKYFRPVRTPEQVAAEELSKFVKRAHKIYVDGAAHEGGLIALYDAGLRFVEVAK